MSTIHRNGGAADEGAPGGTVAGRRLGGFEERLLAELKGIVAQRTAATGQPDARRRARRSQQVRKLMLTTAACAALGAGLAAALTVASSTGRSASAFTSAAKASAVLHHAALAALQEPAFIPRADQFVYSKVYTNESNWPGPIVTQTWQSASGTRFGLESETQTLIGGKHFTWTHPDPICVHGVQKLPPTYYPNVEKHFHPTCTPIQFAWHQPGMPTRPAALGAWMDKNYPIQAGSHAVDLLRETALVLTKYLTPAQRAAVYQLLSTTTPGLRVVPTATTILGHSGVGVRWRLDKGSTYTLVFDRSTYQLLGMNWTGRLSMNGARGGEVLVKLAIVNKAGQLP